MCIPERIALSGESSRILWPKQTMVLAKNAREEVIKVNEKNILYNATEPVGDSDNENLWSCNTPSFYSPFRVAHLMSMTPSYQHDEHTWRQFFLSNKYYTACPCLSFISLSKLNDIHWRPFFNNRKISAFHRILELRTKTKSKENKYAPMYVQYVISLSKIFCINWVSSRLASR